MIQLHGRNGNYEMVEDLVQRMRETGLEAKCGVYDALLLSYCRAGLADQALSVFREYKLVCQAISKFLVSKHLLFHFI